MGLLDGDLQAVFGAAFGGLYLDGTLHRNTITRDADGDLVSTPGSSPSVKGQIERATEAMRAAEGYVDTDMMLLVLQAGVSPAITTDDEITLGGVRWRIANVATDPANTHWILHGRVKR